MKNEEESHYSHSYYFKCEGVNTSQCWHSYAYALTTLEKESVYMEKRYRIKRTLSKMDVRNVCVANDYYTRGDNRAYEEMFSMLDSVSKVSGSNITPYKLYDMAEDIKLHSNTEDTIEDIMNILASRIKCSVFVQED